jgi:hypothetical protein
MILWRRVGAGRRDAFEEIAAAQKLCEVWLSALST